MNLSALKNEMIMQNMEKKIASLTKELETTKKLLDDSINFHFLINELDILGSDNQGKMAAVSRSFLRSIGKFD